MNEHVYRQLRVCTSLLIPPLKIYNINSYWVENRFLLHSLLYILCDKYDQSLGCMIIKTKEFTVKNSIISKLWIAITLLIIIVLLILTLSLSSFIEEFYFTQISNELIKDGQQLIEIIKNENNSEEVAYKVETLANLTNAHLVIVDDEGMVQACNSMMGLPAGMNFNPEELQEVFNGQTVTKVIKNQVFEGPMLAVAIPININNRTTNALMMFKPVNPITDTIYQLRKQILITAIGAIILASVISFFLSRTLSKPLIEMNRVALEMAQGNFNHKVNISSEDEIGLLSSNINYLSTRLQNNIEELSQEKVKLENILTSMSDGVVTLDSNANIILLNPFAQKLFFHDLEDINLEKNFFKNVKNRELQNLFQLVNKEKRSKVKDIEIDGKLFSARMAPLLNLERKIAGVVTVLQDVTKERQLEKMRQDFITNVSHELRTPLSLMQGYSEALIDGMALNKEKQDKIINIIYDETLRLKRMVNELLDLSKLQTGNFTLNKQELDLNQLLEHFCEKYKSIVAKADLEFEVEVDEHLPRIYADYDKIQQALINLIENALKHTKEGKISLKAYEQKERIVIEVIDTGMGIAKEDIEFIWERFYKADKSRNRNQGGTGLGLAIVKSIIEAHNGQLWVKSEEGLGSTFGFNLPKKICLK